MVAKKTVDLIFMVFLGVMGLLVIIFSAQAFNIIPENCTDSIVYDGLTLVMAAGTALFTLSIGFFICNYNPFGKNKMECYYRKDSSSDDVTRKYMFIGLLIALPLFALLMVISIKLKSSDCSAGNNETLKFYVVFLTSLAGIMTVLTIVGIVWHAKITPVIASKADKELPKTEPQRAVGWGGGGGGWQGNRFGVF